MTKILRLKLVQTITMDQILPASDKTKAGPITGAYLDEIKQGADEGSDALLQPGMTMDQQIVSAEVIEI